MKNALVRTTLLAATVIGCQPPPGVDDPPPSDDPVADPTPAARVTQAQREAVMHQIPGRDLSLVPPKIGSMQVLPVAGGQSRLEVTFGEAMPPTLDFIHDDAIVTLRDDGAAGDLQAKDGRYSALLAAGTGAPDGLSVSRSAATTTPPNPNVVPGKALFITDPHVVNNYYRTTDPCHRPTKPHPTDPDPPADDVKKWTFGYLMTQMANQSSTGVSPSTFALEWLDEWAKDHSELHKNQVNFQDLKEIDSASLGHTVARTIKAQWLKASGSNGTLSMKKAPFRLLAIVNRFDKRDNTAFGGGTAGELRFVFGVLDLQKRETTNGACAYMAGIGGTGSSLSGKHDPETNVILEYAVDKPTEAAVTTYAESWATLNSKGITTSGYLNALQTITEGVVTKGKGTATMRANGSALNVLRTNESNDGQAWDLREFAIDQPSHLFKSTTVSQTPVVGLRNSADLDFWANFYAEEIISDVHFVPLMFSTTENQHVYASTIFRATHSATDNGPLTLSSDLPSDIRHHLSLDTCSGCHLDEQVVDRLPPMHVIGQPWGTPAKLSHFLEGDRAGGPYLAPDPVTGEPRPFFDLDRRRQDLADYLTRKGLAQLAFRPLSRVH
jgi:hypothetical protein